MSHQISGRSILRQVKSHIEIYRNNLEDDLSKMKIVIFQFNPPPSLTSSYEISKYKAADTSTSQKCKLFGEFLGCNIEVVKLPHTTQFKDFKKIIANHNTNKNVKGIIIQHPIPPELDSDEESEQILQLIATSKDIDAMSKAGEKLWGRCATADAICRVVDAGLKPECRIVIIGSIGFVGGGVFDYLESKKAELKLEIETINKGGKNSTTSIDKFKELNPSILVSATGQKEIITIETLKDTNIDLLVDCGFIITDEKDEKGNNIIVGDVAKDARELSQFVTPVPGGIGPMEMAVLLERFMMKEFPELNIKPWKLIPLDELSTVLNNRLPENQAPIDYLVGLDLEFRELIQAQLEEKTIQSAITALKQEVMEACKLPTLDFDEDSLSYMRNFVIYRSTKNSNASQSTVGYEDELNRRLFEAIENDLSIFDKGDVLNLKYLIQEEMENEGLINSHCLDDSSGSDMYKSNPIAKLENTNPPKQSQSDDLGESI
jgi:methylenetetrahydrofolate dehydrogenase (NADP+) / methenyltetrahydrofolate cyclohydrolase